MARQQKRLTALKVTNLSRPGLYGDSGGLTLQITVRGAKSWLFRHIVAGKHFAMGLGPTHTVSLADARQKALDARKLLIEGINPLVAKNTGHDRRHCARRQDDGVRPMCRGVHFGAAIWLEKCQASQPCATLLRGFRKQKPNLTFEPRRHSVLSV